MHIIHVYMYLPIVYVNFDVRMAVYSDILQFPKWVLVQFFPTVLSVGSERFLIRSTEHKGFVAFVTKNRSNKTRDSLITQILFEKKGEQLALVHAI